MITRGDVAARRSDAVQRLTNSASSTDLAMLLDATYIVCLAPDIDTLKTSQDGTLGRRAAWFWTEAADLLEQTAGFGAVASARSVTSQFRLAPVTELDDEFFLDVLLLTSAGVTAADLELWWNMRQPHLCRPLNIRVAASAATAWGLPLLNACAQSGLNGHQLERLLASEGIPHPRPAQDNHRCP